MKLTSLLALSAVLIVAVGCGGGGGGTSSTGGGNGGGNGSSTVRLFATDDMNAGFDHVWVNVKQVVLVGASGDRVLFEDAQGRLIDLKTLRDAAGRRFNLLSNRAVSSGHYSGLRVVLDNNVSVFTAGATTATDATFDGATGATKTMELTFASPRELRGGSNLIVDFDLSRWTLNGNVVTATDGQFLAVVEDSRVDDPSRHELDDYKGTISNLSGTAPTQMFTITRGQTTLTVRTDANTSIYNENGAPSPSLTNGLRVEVTGVFSTSTNSLTATSIKIDNDDDDNDEDEVKGQITSVSSANGTVTIDLIRAEGFVPDSKTITIQATDATRFFSDRGVRLTRETFFSQAVVNGYVEAEGTLSGSTLTAFKMKLEDEVGHHGGGNGGGGGGGNDDDDAEVFGAASNISADAGTFTLAVTRWEGLMLSQGAQITVRVANNAEFKVNKNNVSRAQFFSALGSAASVKVEGTYDAATKTFTAREAKIGENGGGGGGGSDDD